MPRCAGAPASSAGDATVRQWTITHSSDFDDLRQVPRWHDREKVIAGAVWGAVGIGVILGAAVLLGRDVATAAWTVPGGLLTFAGALVAQRALERPIEKTAGSGPSPELGAGPEE